MDPVLCSELEIRLELCKISVSLISGVCGQNIRCASYSAIVVILFSVPVFTGSEDL